MSDNGLHHVTAYAGDIQRNLDFYRRVLGLRLVKKTVNFDDPSTYHLYYGDEAGRPGTILTFFPVAHAARGQVGIGETQETAFRVPRASIGWWTHRLIEKGVDHDALVQLFGEPVLRLRDPDGMVLALVGVDEATEGAPSWTGAEVPAEHAIRGFHGVTLLLKEAEPDGADPHRGVRLLRSRARRGDDPLRQWQRRRWVRHPPGGGRVPARPARCRLGPSHRLPGEGTMPSRPPWWPISPAPMACR